MFEEVIHERETLIRNQCVMAFINIHPVSLREQANKGEKGAKAILELRADGQHFFGTILIATNLTQVALITLMSYFLETHFYIQAEWMMTLITAPLVLVFCEQLSILQKITKRGNITLFQLPESLLNDSECDI